MPLGPIGGWVSGANRLGQQGAAAEAADADVDDAVLLRHLRGSLQHAHIHNQLYSRLTFH